MLLLTQRRPHHRGFNLTWPLSMVSLIVGGLNGCRFEVEGGPARLPASPFDSGVDGGTEAAWWPQGAFQDLLGVDHHPKTPEGLQASFAVQDLLDIETHPIAFERSPKASLALSEAIHLSLVKIYLGKRNPALAGCWTDAALGHCPCYSLP